MAVPRKLRCRVTRITDHGDHVYSVELSPEPSSLAPRPSPPSFRPGQFLHLALDDYDPSRFWPDSRVFSIASPPGTTPLRISYSVRGKFTSRMEKELAVERQVWVKLPYGEFVVSTTRPAVLLAGGTGITAFTAFIAGLRPEQRQPVFLAYGARRPELLIYRDLVEKQAAAVPDFRCILFSEAPLLPLLPGCISIAAVWPLIQAPAESSFYLSGPPAMISTLSAELQERRVGADSVRIDAWE